MTNENAGRLREGAEGALAAFEAIPLGDVIAGAEEAALEAIGGLRDCPKMEMFPRRVRLTADAVVGFEFHEQHMRRERYAQDLAELHAEYLDVDPALCAFLRSGAIADRIAAMGAAHAAAIARLPEEIALEFVERFERLIACQLVGRAEFEPAASILALEIPALLARLEACRARHSEHTRAELARLEGERQAAAATTSAAERARRDTVASFFAARPGRMYDIGSRRFAASSLVAVAQRQGGRDEDGYFSLVPLADLELAMRRAQASEAVTA